MAGIITISKGHDAAYPWRQIGTGNGCAGREDQAAVQRSGLGYYLSPAERGGEPPGIWTGMDVADLGLEPGGIVRREVFEQLYGRHADPRDITAETTLGRAPGRYKTADDIYDGLLAAEPHATAERREQLLVEAKAQVRTADLYWDATFSVSKSISLLHASALANATAAAPDDPGTADQWRAVARRIWDCIMEGNAAALAFLQAEAGQTRTGYHPGGRWEDARQWVIASFRQHTSRDGDPQLHVHNLILHKVRRESDGAWRALDSMSLYRHRPAASAIAALVMENALTREFSVQWVQRADGHGREIAGVSQALMDAFSSRRASIGRMTARLARAYEAHFGRGPDARALASLRQWANHATRRGKDAEPLDLAALVRQWSARAAEAEAGALEPLAPAVLRAGAPGRQRAEDTAQRASARNAATANIASAPLTEDQTERLIVEAVAAVQQAQPTWTEADLIRYLGERLPAHLGPMTTYDAAALLPAVARRALAEHAIMLSAPQWPVVPDCLRRASGESLYAPHGAARYTTATQLDLEARLLADAAETCAPRLDPASAARLLGADQALLEVRLRLDQAQAHNGAPSAGTTGAIGCGLRADQASAAFWALTSARRAEVLAGPAGSGKTTTVAAMARMWRQATGGEVIGLATSQTASNVLAAAGIARAYNTARFLGHTKARREARSAMPVRDGSMFIVDEASMMSLADLAAILALARRTGSKVIITGDHAQLAAVEGGGGMALLARRHGYAQLSEPQRFESGWERDATLRLRSGDVTVLAEYEQHGRLRGGTGEDAVEQAYRGWLADHLSGLDCVLIARTEETARELSRRARDDLIRYGQVAPYPVVALAAGEQASVGDLICARRNYRAVRAGAEGRELANRDILRVTAVAAGPRGLHVEVRRHLGREPASGEVAWSEPFCVPRRYLAAHGTLAYAATAHAAIGRTTDTTHVLLDGMESRQGLYVAMSRGRKANHAYCITQPARLADIAAGTRRAPELERAARLDAERTGMPQSAVQPERAAVVLDPVTVLAQIMARDGSELSGTETLERELARADHLAVLGGIWDDLVRRARTDAFGATLRAALPSDLAGEALDDPAVTWLWRSLREAETCGLNGAAVLREAIRARSLANARDVARVIDSRVRRRLDGARPLPPGRWANRVPADVREETGGYLRELAEAMDDRARRLGELTVLTQPLWALQAVGPLPADPTERLDWENRAGTVASYRERYGYDHPADPIGPEPGRSSPEARAAWHGALAALSRIDGVDLRHLTDGQLWLRRGTYERETAWAPPHVGPDLRLVRTAARDAHVNAIRAEHEARATRRRSVAARHAHLARRWQHVEVKAAAEEHLLAEIQDVRSRWESVTESTRRVAIAADLELRRRHPGIRIEPLRPHPAAAVALHAGQPRADRLAMLRLTLDAVDEPIPPELDRLAKEAAAAQARLNQLTSLPLPEEEHTGASPGPAWPERARRQRDAILQPPRPEIKPSARVRAAYSAPASADHGEPEMEAE